MTQEIKDIFRFQQMAKISLFKDFGAHIKDPQDTFGSPTNTERIQGKVYNKLKSSMTYGSKESKYSTNSKLTKSILFGSLNKTKILFQSLQTEKSQQVQFLQDSLINLSNQKLSLAHKLKKQVQGCMDDLQGFFEVLRQN